MAKKILITAIIVLLVAALVFTICCLTVPKLNNWVKGIDNKDEVATTNLVKLESGQVIKGVKFDTTKEPDLSEFEVPIMYMMYPFFDYKDEEGGIEDEPILGVVDFESFGKAVGVEIHGKVLVSNVFDDDLANSIIYADQDIKITGAIADLLDMGIFVKKGWNTELLTKDGELLFKERVEVVNTYHSESWNGVYVGALESVFCKHKVIEQGACKECNKCFHENLGLFETCRVCGTKNDVVSIRHNLNGMRVEFNSSLDEAFQNTEVIATSINGREYNFKYPDFTLGPIDTANIGSQWVSIYVGGYSDSFEIEVVCNDEYHNTLELGSVCSSCDKFGHFLVKINQIDGFDSVLNIQSSDKDNIVSIASELWNSIIDKVSVTFSDLLGNTFVYDANHLVRPSFIYDGTDLICEFNLNELSNYETLRYSIPVYIVD